MVLKEKFTPLNVYITKAENNLKFHLKILEKEKEDKPKASRRKKKK